MVYDALDVPLKSIRVDINFGVPSGITERVSDATLDMPSKILEFMAGAAALVGICGFQFEEKLHTFTSDLCVMLRHKPELDIRISDDEKSMVHLARCRQAAELFVRTWVLQYRRPILRLSAALMQSEVSNNKYALEGDKLAVSISSAWRGIKPDSKDTVTFAREGWRSLPAGIDIGLGWQTYVMDRCKAWAAK